jgi:DnaJ-class molecular chaperone
MTAEGPGIAPGDEVPPDSEAGGANVCPECGGTGRKDGERCEACGGTGQVEEAVGGG